MVRIMSTVENRENKSFSIYPSTPRGVDVSPNGNLVVVNHVRYIALETGDRRALQIQRGGKRVREPVGHNLKRCESITYHKVLDMMVPSVQSRMNSRTIRIVEALLRVQRHAKGHGVNGRRHARHVTHRRRLTVGPERGIRLVLYPLDTYTHRRVQRQVQKQNTARRPHHVVKLVRGKMGRVRVMGL